MVGRWSATPPPGTFTTARTSGLTLRRHHPPAPLSPFFGSAHSSSGHWSEEVHQEVCEQGWSAEAEGGCELLTWVFGGPRMRSDSTQGPDGLQPDRPGPSVESESRDVPLSQGLPVLLDPCPLTLG